MSRGKNGSLNSRLGGFRDDHRDRLAAAGDEAPGRPVGDVSESIDGLLDRAANVGAHLGRPVDHARDRGAGHARDPGDLVQRRDGSGARGLELRHGRSARTVRVVRALSRSETHHITPLSRERLQALRGWERTLRAPCVRGPRAPGGRVRDSRSWPSGHPRGEAAAPARRPLRGRHRHRGPLPAADRVEDVLRAARRPTTAPPRTATSARSASGCRARCPVINRARRGARPGDRPRDRGHDAGRHALGPQELLLPGPAQGLPDQPVRPAARLGRPAGHRDVRRPVHRRDHARPPRGGHRQARPRHRRGRHARSAWSTSTAPAHR